MTEAPHVLWPLVPWGNVKMRQQSLKKSGSPINKITACRIADLSSNPRNARTHSASQIQEIARSIERFGFNNPVLIDRSSQIIAGHGRVEAAKLLGHKKVPALRLEHMSEEDKRAYVLADNKLAEKAGWEPEILAIEFRELVELGFDVELTGFELPEIDLILDSQNPTASSAAEQPIPQLEPERIVTKDNDLWTLGGHRLLCGDARREELF